MRATVGLRGNGVQYLTEKGYFARKFQKHLNKNFLTKVSLISSFFVQFFCNLEL